MRTFKVDDNKCSPCFVLLVVLLFSKWNVYEVMWDMIKILLKLIEYKYDFLNRKNHFIFVFIMDATTLQLVYWDNKYGNIYTRTRHISSFVITSPNPRIGNENGVVIIEEERLQKNEAFKFIYYIVMLLLDPFTISSTIPCLKYI